MLDRLKNSDALLALIREGKDIAMRDRLRLTFLLSLPSIMAQLSAILMQYIDAAMVGSLGAGPSASIGLVSTTTWLFWGLCTAVVSGFSVQVAQLIGASKFTEARAIVRQGLLATIAFSAVVAAIGLAISGSLPRLLGAGPEIWDDASTYFLIFSAGLPLFQLGYFSGAVLRCSGNMMVPGMLNILMCVLDVIFNALLIFPSREIWGMRVYGAGLGVTGAALGTLLAESTVGLIMWGYMWYSRHGLEMRRSTGSFIPRLNTLKRAVRIGLPLAAEHAMVSGAQIVTTLIVAPLGTIAIAANSFAIIAESLCYMPGYGIGEAATTLVGQSVGAARKRLAYSFARITVYSGMVIMTLMGIVMYLTAPALMDFFTPDSEVSRLGVSILRIEAWAEPMFAAAIVAYGAFVGAGDTLIPSCMNFGSIWTVRLTLAAILAPGFGLQGVWIAMCGELCFRGLIFLWRLYSRAWLRSSDKIHPHLTST